MLIPSRPAWHGYYKSPPREFGLGPANFLLPELTDEARERLTHSNIRERHSPGCPCDLCAVIDSQVRNGCTCAFCRKQIQ